MPSDGEGKRVEVGTVIEDTVVSTVREMSYVLDEVCPHEHSRDSRCRPYEVCTYIIVFIHFT